MKSLQEVKPVLRLMGNAEGEFKGRNEGYVGTFEARRKAREAETTEPPGDTQRCHILNV